MEITTRKLFNFIQGSDITGESSFDIWKSLYPDGTEQEFLEFIKSESIYDDWVKLEGNEGKTKEEFLASLSGVSSWNDLTDKPFGNEVTVDEDVRFTGDYENYPYFGGDPNINTIYVKVSDYVYTEEDLAGAQITWYDTNRGVTTYEVGMDCVISTPTNDEYFGTSLIPNVPHGQSFMVSCSVPSTSENAYIKEPGTYFIRESGDRYTMSVSGVKKATTAISTLDPKYLPVNYFDMPFSVVSGGYCSFTDLKKVKTAFDNNFVIHIIYRVFVSGGGYITSHFALPWKDCNVYTVATLGVFGTMSDERVKVYSNFNIRDYENGVLTIESADFNIPISAEVLKCYASLF